MSPIRYGALIAALVLAGFVIYAFFAPATYRSSALLTVAPVASGAKVAMPEPLEAGRRLRDAILDRETLDRLAQERAGSSAPELRARAASQVRDGLTIDTSDGRVFSVSYDDKTAERAQRICGELAQQGLKQAPTALDVTDRERTAALKRQRQTQELAAFLALHPEVANAQTGSPRPENLDVALSALRSEKTLVERRLAGGASDNPYDDPAESNPTLLKRRLAELDSAIVVRKKSLENQAAAQKLSPELAAEYRRLVEAIAGGAQAEVAEPQVQARMLSAASKPGWPVEPNRPLCLFFGVVFGTGLGVAYTLVLRSAQRRRASSRPPPGGGETQRIAVPKAPGVPSDLAAGMRSTGPRSALSSTLVMPRPQSVTPAPGAARSPSEPPRSPSEPPRSPSEPPRPPSEPPRPPSEPPLQSYAGRQAPAPTFSAPGDADPVLAAAEQAWDRAVRTNNVPGFAVVGQVPPRLVESVVPPPVSNAAPPAVAPRGAGRAAHKVTQPLGSFLPDGFAGLAQQGFQPPVSNADQRSQPPPGVQPSPAPEYPPRSPPPRSPLPAKGTPTGVTRYSYVSTAPPPNAAGSSVVRVETIAQWAPPAALDPSSRRGICQQLYPQAVDRCLVVAVIAVPESVDHKSRVAAELALALGESGHPRVLLLEADFHRSRVHRAMGVEMPMGAGFSQQMHARIQGSQGTAWTVVACTSTLHVLAEGVMRSPGLLGSELFAEAVRDLRSYYDFVVIDGPTLSLELDAAPLNAVCDGLVVACPANAGDSLLRVTGLFEQKRVNAVAVVPNGS